MRSVERIAFAIRHNHYLERADRLWNCVRPAYDRFSSLAARKGLTRVINGTDTVLIASRWRMVAEEYEPEVWQHLMSQIRPGDVVADVGAYIGLYTIAVAKRAGPGGRVVAFEPDPVNFTALQEHVKLNGLADRVELRQAAAGATDCRVDFAADASSESSVSSPANASANANRIRVECETLDRVFAGRHLDILKIDVEGYEGKVIEGATRLLRDGTAGPRIVFIEVHPWAWQAMGTTSESLLSLFRQCGYEVRDLKGKRVKLIRDYGEVVASRP